MKRFALMFPALFALAACTDIAPRAGGDILVIGDSVLAWNGTGGANVGDGIARSLQRNVVSKAVPGAQIDNTSGVAGAVGFDIMRQLPRGRWNWVVMNGGANDLSSDCGCAPCAPSVSAFIDPGATTGTIPAFIRQVQRQTGAQVLWMGYYAGSGSGSFAGCRQDLVELERRIARFAATTPGVYFADAEDVIDRGDRALFAPDNVHPSVKGSGIIAAYLAGVITRAEKRSQNPG